MNIVDMFEYDKNASFGVRDVYARIVDGSTVRDFTYLNPFGGRRAAFLVRPAEETGRLPALLYVHWYEPEAADSNRTEFLEEATEMARRGVVSLLVETMWSDRDWFTKREQGDDVQNCINQVVELRRALDLLASQPGVDPDNMAYVGHDFGAMHGVVLGAVDPRPKCYVLMAGTPRFPDWFLYYPKLEGEDRDLFIESFVEIDPITLVPNLAPAPVFFQLGDADPHVPRDRGEEFSSAARLPKKIRWYEAGHHLNNEATSDRLAWLGEQLGIETT